VKILLKSSEEAIINCRTFSVIASVVFDDNWKC